MNQIPSYCRKLMRLVKPGQDVGEQEDLAPIKCRTEQAIDVIVLSFVNPGALSVTRLVAVPRYGECGLS